MNEYTITPSKRLGLPREDVMAKSPKDAVVAYAKKYNLAYSKIMKITSKILKSYNTDYTNMDNYVDFSVYCASAASVNSGGMYKLVL